MKEKQDHKKIWGHGYHAGLKENCRGSNGNLYSVKDTMVCWNPGTDQIKIFEIPNTNPIVNQYACSGLGAYTHVQKMDFEGRKTMAFITAMTLIIRDKCDPKTVHNVFLDLEEYRDGCSDDMLRKF